MLLFAWLGMVNCFEYFNSQKLEFAIQFMHQLSYMYKNDAKALVNVQ